MAVLRLRMQWSFWCGCWLILWAAARSSCRSIWAVDAAEPWLYNPRGSC